MSENSNRAAIEAWGRNAVAALAAIGEKGDFARQHLLNPSIFELLGDVAGLRILDAGCGNGYLSRLSSRRGALVVGVEPVSAFVDYALEREAEEPLGVEYVRADLAYFTRPAAFDAVVANMVFMDIPDFEPALRNCVACLVSGGLLVFSILHPCFEEGAAAYARRGAIEVREYLEEFVTSQTLASTLLYHRPLSRYLNLTIDAGCAIKRIVEPRLAATVADANPEYRRDAHVPSFLIVAAVKI